MPPVVELERASSNMPVFFFDIDNCLYPQSTGVETISLELLHGYLENHLGVSKGNTNQLLQKYRNDHGFVLEGLFRDPRVDPMEFNSSMDDALSVESLLKPDPKLRKLLEDIDTSKVRLWLLTNSYITHANRVVKILGIDDLFEGVTYCDYQKLPLVCKPQVKMFEEAMRAAGVENKADCYFVDDSFRNCQGAREFGLTAVHFVEEGVPSPELQASQHQIQSLEELRTLFPLFFKA